MLHRDRTSEQQNVPTKTGGIVRTVGGGEVDSILDSLNIRSWFTPSRAAHVFIAADYSQIEMRLMAHLCGDAALCKLFNSSGDVYYSLASHVCGVPIHAVTPEQRKQAKVVSLGILYGIGVQEVSKQLAVDAATAGRIRSQFLQRFPSMTRFMDSVKRYAAANGYVTTMAGRRRYMPDIRSPEEGKRLQAERQAVNTVVQGTAADLLKLAMVVVREVLLGVQPCLPHCGVPEDQVSLLRAASVVLTVHDELIVQCPANPTSCTAVARALKWCMEQVAPRMLVHLNPRRDGGGSGGSWEDAPALRVPLTVSLSIGDDWGNMEGVSLDVEEDPGGASGGVEGASVGVGTS